MRTTGRQLQPLERDDLHRKLVWITFFRLIVVTVLLAATAVLTFSERDQLPGEAQLHLYGLAVAVYLASVGYLVAMRWGPGSWLAWIAYIQVFGDVLLAGFLVWLTGGGESIFSFLFSLGIINAAILVYRKGALLAAVASALSFAAITLAMQWGVLLPAASFVSPQQLSFSRLAFVLFVNGAGFVLVAILASYLSEQERRAERRLTQATKGLAALEALHERIVESVASGLLTLDPEDRVTFVNPAGIDLLGVSIYDVRGERLGSVLPEMARAISGRVSPARGEVLVEREGEQRQIGFTVNELAPVGSDPGGSVVVFQDLTALRRMEERARRNERLAAVGALAAGLAHEIRNPLASMSGSVEILRSELPSGARHERLMDIVLRETDRLNGLLEDFLRFARPSTPRRELVALRAVISDAVDLFRNDPEGASCDLNVEVDDGLVVEGDAGQLQRAFLNLLLNAAQATGGKGGIRVGAEKADGRLRIWFSDDGPGVARADLDRIFDPFFTTRERGTGLGLALVHRTMEAHGGHVEVESEVGKGSRFTVTLPAVDSEVGVSASTGS